MLKDAVYWIALAHLPGWGNFRINSLINKIITENTLSLEEFFQLTTTEWKDKYVLKDKEIDDLKKVQSELPNIAFISESLFNQGFELIPVTSPEYSKTLINNLKVEYAPPLLYIKGDNQILEENSIAIVGSRISSDISLQFTDNIAKLASKEFKVVVSGFAKGVDKQALDSAIKYIGRSIIVLPQGVMTFGYGYKAYYNQIVEGNVLVLSTFFPKAPWKADLAMARNPIIYGLAKDIYVAESSDKGGTWSGVKDGLRKGRKIFVRKPDDGENNANNLLIQMGAVPVDFNGVELKPVYPASTEVKNPILIQNNDNSVEKNIQSILKERPLKAKEILVKLKLDWTMKKLTNFLSKLDFIEISKEKGCNKYKIKGTEDTTQIKLFG